VWRGYEHHPCAHGDRTPGHVGDADRLAQESSKQAGIIGLDTFFQVLTRSITLEELVEKVCRRIGIKGRAIRWQNAEPCMDVDKPHQLELMRADLANQQRKAAARAKSCPARGKGSPAREKRKRKNPPPERKWKPEKPAKAKRKAPSRTKLKQ
jgi:hypothetical protein